MSEPQLRQLVNEHGFSLHNISYRLQGGLGQFEFRTVVRTQDTANLRRLSETLNGHAAVIEYRLSPTSE
jgi:putative Mg2+ transporter-C (MgtC) family protein